MEKIKNELCVICNQVKEMIEITYQGFKNNSLKRIEEAVKIGKSIHSQNEELTNSLIKKELFSLVGFPGHFERMGGAVESILISLITKEKENLMLSDKAVAEVSILFEKTCELLKCLHDTLKTKNNILIEHIAEKTNEINRLASQYADKHEERLVTGVCIPKVAPIYLDILDSLKVINGHIREMAKKL